MPEDQESGMELIPDLVRSIVHYFTIVVALGALVGLLAFLVRGAFERGVYEGVRSLASSLLPFIAVTFIYVFYRRGLSWLSAVYVPLSFGISLVWGLAIMLILDQPGVPYASTRVPAMEGFVSTTVALLVYVNVDTSQQRASSYYYGMVIGFLAYVVLFGIPASVVALLPN